VHSPLQPVVQVEEQLPVQELEHPPVHVPPHPPVHVPSHPPVQLVHPVRQVPVHPPSQLLPQLPVQTYEQALTQSELQSLVQLPEQFPEHPFSQELLQSTVMTSSFTQEDKEAYPEITAMAGRVTEPSRFRNSLRPDRASLSFLIPDFLGFIFRNGKDSEKLFRL